MHHFLDSTQGQAGGRPLVDFVPDRPTSSAWTPPSDLLDLAAEVGAQVMDELIDVFLEDVSGKLRAVRAAFEKADFDSVRKLAHSLKGGSAQIGAKPLAALCLQMEIAATVENKLVLQRLICAVEREFATVGAAMVSFLHVPGDR